MTITRIYCPYCKKWIEATEKDETTCYGDYYTICECCGRIIYQD